MPDFDFDELDKAVTGALRSDSSDDVDTSRVVDSQNTPSPEPKVPKSEEQTVEKAAPVAPAARRSAGRFMDVVHPSSDMRGRTSSGQLMSHKETPASFTPPASTKEQVLSNETPRDEPEGVAKDWSQPLESPFLPDAKVEKRPLGAFATRESSMSSAQDDEELLLEAPDDPRLEAHTMPDPIDFAAQSAALESETEDTGLLDANQTTEVTSEEVVVEEGATIEDVTATDTKAPSLEDAVASLEEQHTEPEMTTSEEVRHDEVHGEPETETTPVETVTGPTSISQQYEEKPTTEQESGAIYDTETYHQPLASSTKKHSSAWTILWIFLLVVLGAGAGVAFYLFVLPML